MAEKQTKLESLRLKSARGERADGVRAADTGRFIEIFGKDGLFRADAATRRFGMSKGQLAETAGIKPESLHRKARAGSNKVQSRMAEMIEIVSRVSAWAGGEKQAMAWYRAEPIPAFGDRTAESLVKSGKAAAVRDYLDHLAMGGFA